MDTFSWFLQERGSFSSSVGNLMSPNIIQRPILWRPLSVSYIVYCFFAVSAQLRIVFLTKHAVNPLLQHEKHQESRWRVGEVTEIWQELFFCASCFRDYKTWLPRSFTHCSCPNSRTNCIAKCLDKVFICRRHFVTRSPNDGPLALTESEKTRKRRHLSASYSLVSVSSFWSVAVIKKFSCRKEPYSFH